MSNWNDRDDPNAHLPLPLTDTIRKEIRRHFAGRIGRAFAELEPDMPGDGFEGGACCRSEFYRAMRGEWIRATKIAHIEYRWCLYDRGTSVTPPVPRDSKELKIWIQKEFGFLCTLHKELFSDWSYATLRNAVAGIGTESRLAELYDRLAAYREAENARRREPILSV